MAARHSGLQLRVLSLYRRALRVARSKAPEHVRGNLEHVTTVFRRDAQSVKKTDFRTIEFMVRQGEKQLKTVSAPSVSRFGSS